MARPKLESAMRSHGYSFQKFAKEMDVSFRTVWMWVHGDTKRIRSHYVPLICGKLGLSLEDLEDMPLPLNIDIGESNGELEAISSDQEDLEEPMEISRRKAASYASLMAVGFSFLPGTTTLSGPIIGPDEYLAQCEDTINTCWAFINQGNYGKVARTLGLHVPTLTQFANTESEHQSMAAELSVQATIQQMILANHSFDYAARKKLGADAVRFGHLSKNPFALASALDWHGSTFISCYRQPLRAIALYNEALSELGDEASLNRSSLYNGLSIAYAMIKDELHKKENEKIALNYAKMAREIMPTFPELDPFYHYIRMGTSELDQYEARAYLFLARHFPQGDYGETAYNLFNSSLEKESMSTGYRCLALYMKADACIVQNKMTEFEESLRKGFDIAVSSNHQGHLSRVHGVVSHIPQKWKKETLIKTLQSDIAQVPVVIARR